MGLSKHCLLALSFLTILGLGCEKNRKADTTHNGSSVALAQVNADILEDVPGECVHVRVNMRSVSYDVRNQKGSTSNEIPLTQGAIKQGVIASLRDGLKAPLNQTPHICLSAEPNVPAKTVMATLNSSVHTGATAHSLLFLDNQSKRRAYSLPKRGCCAPVAKDSNWALASTCEYCQWAVDQRHERGPRCLRSTVSLDQKGASITARPGVINGEVEGLPIDLVASLGGQSTGNDFHLMDNVMITDGACPSVQGTDAKTLSGFLQKLDKVMPLCDDGMLAMADDVPWSRVAEAIDAMAAAGTRQITLTPGALNVSCDRQARLNENTL